MRSASAHTTSRGVGRSGIRTPDRPPFYHDIAASLSYANLGQQPRSASAEPPTVADSLRVTLRALPFLGGFRSPAPLPLDRSPRAGMRNPSRKADLQIAALRLPHTPPSRLPSHPQFSCRDPAGRSRTVRRPLGISGSGFGGDERGGVVDARARVRSRWRHRG